MTTTIIHTCEYCGKMDRGSLITVNGYQILPSCDDCKEEILNDEIAQPKRALLIQNALKVGIPLYKMDSMKNSEIIKITDNMNRLLDEISNDDTQYLE